MDIKSIRDRLETIGLDTNTIEEILPLIVEQESPVSDGRSALLEERRAIQMTLDNEPDWRKRATLAARLISIDLGA